MKKNIQIGQVLLGKGYIDEKQLQRAIDLQKKSPGKRLGDILVELSYVTERKLLESLAERLNVPFIDLRGYTVNPKAAMLLSHSYAKKHHILPIDFQNNKLVVATDDPLAFYTIDEIRTLTGYEISTVVSTWDDLDYTIEKIHSQDTVSSAVEDLNREFQPIQEDEDIALMGDRVEGTPMAKLINTIITQACVAGASDIHIEPGRKNLVVRIRINGDLVHHATMNLAAHTSIVTRLKLLSEMNIAEKRLPQDGKFHFSGAEFETDIRASSLPTIYGEKIVLRLLGNSARPELLDLQHLGMDAPTLEKYTRMVKSPSGIVLVTGPTGSGKTTTLYATLNQMAQRKINIVTVEDPVERRIDTINQVQVNNKAGLTFASALRSILRQDPDIIMVGEMRDGETATLGVRAAITGHLVFSTIHTNDAVSSIARLVDMGAASYMVAAALTGVVAQRLVKVLCPHCKDKRALLPQERLLLGADVESLVELYEPNGCERCNYTGYRGRVPIYEIIQVDGPLRDMIANGAAAHEMKTYEQEKGTKFLRDRVVELAKAGETGLEEIEKIIFSVE